MNAAGIPNGPLLWRALRILFLVGAFLLLATIVTPNPPLPPGGPVRSVVTATAVMLDGDDGGRRRVGDLVFRRGWTLTSPDRRFGGLSAMHVEGGEVTAISDSGVLFRFPLPRAAGPLPLRVAPLPGSRGAAKRDQDTEAMVVRGDRMWLAFEARNGIARLHRRDLREEALAQPEAMRRWRRNKGPEAMVRLADGRFLLLAEGPDDASVFSDALLFRGDPAEAGTAAAPLRYRRPPGYRVTDAALLPDGRLLVLHRRFRWLEGISAKLAIVDLAGLRSSAILEPREIAALRAPLTVDNMEALSVAREGGRTIVRIASDDNHMTLQRTLLLEFALEPSG